MTLDTTLEDRDGTWVLTLRRAFAHPAETVWPWLTAPDRLAQWSPAVPDTAFDTVGPRRVRENPDDETISGDVLAIEPPHELVHRWGDDVLRWRLEDGADGCVLTLEHSTARRDMLPSFGAGWQICLDALDRGLAGNPSRAVGVDALGHGWEQLRDEYAVLLGVRPGTAAHRGAS
ncbi:SRPBCC domain-containing protein [Tsukamurella sp. 8F]|uniref:SRPBCC domain-containing protein n=1 Tax=unclassified Tsukamurella TaxID=2633480 RepID=UPI0023B8CE1E|nr:MULTISPECIES: SRPBCC domain-containing protein [unclassified Tsukamurella]MDF0531194.1 SRPBCC domain-containing protein [Tsukamurella sp. 8J]MDF0585859.1 SRPBCC domain-containing protein [Tsukamurella sp. 8F]